MKIPILAHIAGVSFFLPAAIGIYKWKLHNTTIKVFIAFCCFSAVHVTVEYIFGRLGKPTQTLSNYHQLIEFVCLMYVYYKIVQTKNIKDTIQYAGLLYILIWLISYWYNETPENVNESIQTMGRLLLIIISTIVLAHVFKITNHLMSKDAVFWIAGGTILYCTGSIVIVTMANTLLKMNIEYFVMLWYVNWSFTIVANISYSRGFLCKTS